MTRPRISSEVRVWITVFEEDISNHAEAGNAMKSVAMDSQKMSGLGERDEGDSEKGGGAADDLPSPMTVVRGEDDGGGERSAAGGAHEEAERMRGAVQNSRREDRHQRGVGHAHQADDGEQDEDGADGRHVADIGPAGAEVFEDGGLAEPGWSGEGDAHHEQRDDDGDVADAVGEEAVAFARDCDDDAGERGAEEAGEIDDGGVERDGAARGPRGLRPSGRGRIAARACRRS